MLYLSRFTFPDAEWETGFLMGILRKCYDTFYPFKVLSSRGLEEVEFEPITLFYGGNGSGKTTALNVIAEKLRLQRDSRYNRSSFFEDYTDACRYELRTEVPPESRAITSDDVFDFMLNLRTLNQGIDEKREDLFQEYMDAKYSDFHFRTMEDYDRLKTVNLSRRSTQSRYVRKKLMDNLPEHSNGESAFYYFTQRIQENALYLLDEPENSLSASRQMELAEFLAQSARFFGCQLVISTHSPFLLAIPEAKIYDLDGKPPRARRWTELENVRLYRDFFRRHEDAFRE